MQTIDIPVSPSAHPSTCEGDLMKIGDASSWESWLSIRDAKTKEQRQRLFCSRDCLHRWIDARRQFSEQYAAQCDRIAVQGRKFQERDARETREREQKRQLQEAFKHEPRMHRLHASTAA